MITGGSSGKRYLHRRDLFSGEIQKKTRLSVVAGVHRQSK